MVTRSHIASTSVEDVRREEDRPTLVGAREDQVADLLAADRIEAAHGLVEDEHLRVGDERRGEGGALEHALGEAAHGASRGVRDAHLLQHLGPARSAGPLRPERRPQSSTNSRGVRYGIDVGVLREEADAPRARGPGRAAEEGGLAAAGVDEAREHLDGGRLAGAVRAEEAEDLAAPHGEAHALHRVHALLRKRPRRKVFWSIAHLDERSFSSLSSSDLAGGRGDSARRCLRYSWSLYWILRGLMPRMVAALEVEPLAGFERAEDGEALEVVDGGSGDARHLVRRASRRWTVGGVGELDAVAVAQHHGALDGVLQLAHVARPGVGDEGARARRRRSPRCACRSPGVAPRKKAARGGMSLRRSRSGGISSVTTLRR
jgi:hypothetical protein